MPQKKYRKDIDKFGMEDDSVRAALGLDKTPESKLKHLKFEGIDKMPRTNQTEKEKTIDEHYRKLVEKSNIESVERRKILKERREAEARESNRRVKSIRFMPIQMIPKGR